MSALLKIVQGPNAGAEIALPDGVQITVGTADTCDIVLADPTLPSAPMTLSATSGGVTLDGTPLEPFHVLLRGSTALAVGPSDSPWPDLVWPSPSGSAGTPPASSETAPESVPPATSPTPGSTGGSPVPPPQNPTPPKNPKKSRLLPLLILLAIVLLLLAVWAILHARSSARAARLEAEARAQAAALAADQALADFATLHNLVLDKTGPRPRLVGNFPNRTERLAASATAYTEFPGVILDLTDDESLLTAANDVLALLSEGTLAVTSAADRSIALGGTAASPDALQRTIDALRADIPRLENIDHSAVILASAAPAETPEAAAARRAAARRARANQSAPSGVSGILSTPYPYLLLGNGARIFEGATLGDSTVIRIEPDCVTLTNSSGRFEWKP